jgi:hypothetical protein
MWDAWLCANRCGVFQSGVYSCDPNPCEPTSIVSEREAQVRLILSVVPNPVTRSTRFHYALPCRERVEIDIFDPAGRCVRRLPRRGTQVTTGSLSWDGCDDSGVRVSAGAYLCRLTAGGQSTSTLVIVLGE